MFPTDRQYRINVTRAAADQIQLIYQHDYTLKDHFFRIKIGGKGCDGFTYDTGFSLPNYDDIHLEYPFKHEQHIKIIVDPFTAHYCKEAELDYLLNPNNNEDGFVFLNKNEHLYAGKFFKDTEMVPRFLDKESK